MQKKTKILIILIIIIFSSLSLFLVFSLKGIFAKAKEAKDLLVEEENQADSMVELILGDIIESVSSKFSRQGIVDFEWQYSDGFEVKSFNVVGLGISAKNIDLDFFVLKNYFEANNYILDKDNEVTGDMSGLYGYMKDDVACLVSGVNSDSNLIEFDYSSENFTYNIDVQCGFLSEQDLMRLFSAENDIDQINEEYEAKTIVKSYLSKLNKYQVLNGGNIEIIDIKRLDCPGCWDLSVSFEVDAMASSTNSERIKLNSTIELNDWVASSSIIYPQ